MKYHQELEWKEWWYFPSPRHTIENCCIESSNAPVIVGPDPTETLTDWRRMLVLQTSVVLSDWLVRCVILHWARMWGEQSSRAPDFPLHIFSHLIDVCQTEHFLPPEHREQFQALKSRQGDWDFLGHLQPSNNNFVSFNKLPGETGEAVRTVLR